MLIDTLQSVYDTVETEPFEVIVVDNASTDGSIEAARARFPSVTYIENDRNNWFTGATNQAILASRGEYLFCLNPDTVCHPGAVDGLIRFLEEHPSAGLAGPRLLNGDGTLQPSCRNFLTSRRLVLQHILPWRHLPNSWRKHAVLEYWDHDETMKVDWIIGAAIMLPRKAVEEVGLKDEGYPIFHEETDWCYRLKKAGWDSWFVHDLEITHFGSTTVSRLWGRGLVLEFYHGKHRFIGKHYGTLPLLLHRSLLALLLTARLGRALAKKAFRGGEAVDDELAVVRRGISIQLGNRRNLR